jgi:DNA-binding winged helix-turn-helix (wHTH) protein
MDDFTNPPQFWIGDLLVVPGRNMVVRNREEIPLQPRMMAALILLAEQAGKVISCERLLITIWGTEVYGDNLVQKAISSLRKSIDDLPRNPRYIETVPRIGYRLIASVSPPERQPPI